MISKTGFIPSHITPPDTNGLKPVVKELSYLVQFSRFRQLQIPEISRFCLFDLGFRSKGFDDSFLPGLDGSFICRKNHYFQPNFALSKINKKNQDISEFEIGKTMSWTLQCS